MPELPDAPEVRVRPLTVADREAAFAVHAELAPEGFTFLREYRPDEPWEHYVERVNGWRRGIDAPDGFVLTASLVGVAGPDLAGRLSVRLVPEGELFERIGHIGYGVRPRLRRRGYASQMLRQGLVLARSYGVEQALVSCDDDNEASARVITGVGGAVEIDRWTDTRGVKRRFLLSPGPDELWLRPLTPADEAVAAVAHEELADDDFLFLLDRDRAGSWAEYVDLMASWRLARDLPADRVPAAFLVAQVGPDVVGRVSIRFELNDYLRREGGHIGYGVRPGFRKRGYATEILRQALVVVRAEGVDRVLVTCDDDNEASARVIQANGGVEEPGSGGVRRFWIS